MVGDLLPESYVKLQLKTKRYLVTFVAGSY